METKYKFEGTSVLLEISHAEKVDSDKDGVSSIEATVAVTAKLNGLEMADEFLKNSDIAVYIKQKLGMA
jgi:hypothetical protein